MGSQRPLDTVRGIVDAVWRDGDTTDTRKVWVHPQMSGVDIDLTVFTTDTVPGTQNRSVDFHELYWAHHMSETKTVAVLMWLFELARKGPRLRPDMGALWWAGGIFLSLVVFSLSLLFLRATVMFTGIGERPNWIVSGTSAMLLIGAALAALTAHRKRAVQLRNYAGMAALILAIVLVMASLAQSAAVVNYFLPTAVALIAMLFLMGRPWGLILFLLTYILSAIFELVVVVPLTGRFDSLDVIWPWKLDSPICAAASVVILGVYAVINVAFLQPYLGDAARYFRNAPGNVMVRRAIRKDAVETIEQLHTCGKYDRIVVVAHSLGTAVAYDMLRSYFGRICGQLPADPKLFGREFQDVDSGRFNRAALRRSGRTIIRRMAQIEEEDRLAREKAGESKELQASGVKAWLVTDFVTLGSPLTHARFFLCDGRDYKELRHDFRRRKLEREAPTCPPLQIDHDGLLTFFNPRTRSRQIHNGAMFALTRWTNIYFPMFNLLWGDAIGGKVSNLFGWGAVDAPVSVADPPVNSFFAHVRYWDIAARLGRSAPHIVALRDALDLADSGIADDWPHARANL